MIAGSATCPSWATFAWYATASGDVGVVASAEDANAVKSAKALAIMIAAATVFRAYFRVWCCLFIVRPVLLRRGVRDEAVRRGHYQESVTRTEAGVRLDVVAT